MQHTMLLPLGGAAASPNPPASDLRLVFGFDSTVRELSLHSVTSVNLLGTLQYSSCLEYHARGGAGPEGRWAPQCSQNAAPRTQSVFWNAPCVLQALVFQERAVAFQNASSEHMGVLLRGFVFFRMGGQISKLCASFCFSILKVCFNTA